MRRYDPMMQPHFYHLWSGYLREHGYEGAGDYWISPTGRPHSFLSACETVYLSQAPARLLTVLQDVSHAFLKIARANAPAIRAFHEDLVVAGVIEDA